MGDDYYPAGIARGQKEIWKVDRKEVFAVLDLNFDGSGFLSVAERNWDGSVIPVSVSLTESEIMLLKQGLKVAGVRDFHGECWKMTIHYVCGPSRQYLATISNLVDILLFSNRQTIVSIKLERIYDR
jgi:hypothetical protein